MMWWLSFCDTTLPKGQQFLGACIVRGADLREAVLEAWRVGCNPGGAVKGKAIDDGIEPLIRPDQIGVLMDKGEIDRFDRDLMARMRR